MRTVRKIVNRYHTLGVISELEQFYSFDKGWHVIDEYQEQKQTKDIYFPGEFPEVTGKIVGMTSIHRN